MTVEIGFLGLFEGYTYQALIAVLKLPHLQLNNGQDSVATNLLGGLVDSSAILHHPVLTVVEKMELSEPQACAGSRRL